MLNVYADATLADIDHSKVLSIRESLYLGIALSLDSLAVGFGVGFTPNNIYEIATFSLAFNVLALVIGSSLGKKFAKKISSDPSWISGIILMILALLKLY